MIAVSYSNQNVMISMFQMRLGTFGATGGRLALQGDVWRYSGTFGATGGRLALKRGTYKLLRGLTKYPARPSQQGAGAGLARQ